MIDTGAGGCRGGGISARIWSVPYTGRDSVDERSRLAACAFEGLGSMAQWLDAAGLQTSYTRFFADDPLPALDRVDMLIALGVP